MYKIKIKKIKNCRYGLTMSQLLNQEIQETNSDPLSRGNRILLYLHYWLFCNNVTWCGCGAMPFCPPKNKCYLMSKDNIQTWLLFSMLMLTTIERGWLWTCGCFLLLSVLFCNLARQDKIFNYLFNYV
jgi:hypothetical protein